MTIATTIGEARHFLEKARQPGATIGLVPTMGYLHEGHLSLVRRARADCDVVVVSIFVNPMQFGPTEDLDRYPRDFERDSRLCAAEGVDLIFHPDVAEMYPGGSVLTHVEVDRVGEGLCGAHRPGHFRGVATVVAKLFHIVQPHKAYFGEKDYQQLVVIRQMVEDLNLPVEVIGCPTVREPDGLALSSRNSYLSREERTQAVAISQALFAAKKRLEGRPSRSAAVSAASSPSRQDAGAAAQWVRERIEEAPLARVEYVEVADAWTLGPPDFPLQPVVIAVAVWLGGTRLIDNVVVRR